jgi:hypothetical protein
VFGESAQFSVAVRLPDATISTPTKVKWIASPPSFLQVDASGRATAGSVSGGAVITVVVNSSTYAKQVSKDIAVVPAGTFFLTGTVSDAEFPTSRIAGARVEVTPGPPGEPTDVDGRYRLYGISPISTIRVTADGYEPLEQSLAIGGDATQNFLLTSSRPHPNLAGLYTLAIDVIDACTGSSSLSPELRHRRYDATLTQTGLTVDVLLTEPRFEISRNKGNHFSGRVNPGSVTFTLADYLEDDWNYGGAGTYPDVAERLPNKTFLIAFGTAVTTESAAGLSGVLSGGLENLDSSFPGSLSTLGVCSKPRFMLTPR